MFATTLKIYHHNASFESLSSEFNDFHCFGEYCIIDPIFKLDKCYQPYPTYILHIAYLRLNNILSMFYTYHRNSLVLLRSNQYLTDIYPHLNFFPSNKNISKADPPLRGGFNDIFMVEYNKIFRLL